MRNNICLLASALSLALVLTTVDFAWAQGPGATPIGREGYAWQHGIDKAQEDLARLEVDLARLSETEWRAKALAWVQCEAQGEPKPSGVKIEASFRVAEVAADKRTEVARFGDDLHPRWVLTFAKRPPKKLELVLTDEGRTEVTCTTSKVLQTRHALVGVFQYDGSILCLSRPSGGSPRPR